MVFIYLYKSLPKNMFIIANIVRKWFFLRYTKVHLKSRHGILIYIFLVCYEYSLYYIPLKIIVYWNIYDFSLWTLNHETWNLNYTVYIIMKIYMHLIRKCNNYLVVKIPQQTTTHISNTVQIFLEDGHRSNRPICKVLDQQKSMWLIITAKPK